MSSLRLRARHGVVLGACALAAVTIATTPLPAATPSATPSVPASRQIPSSAFWAAKQNERDAPLAGELSTAYEGNTETRFLSLVQQAKALGHTGHAWRNAGPEGGVVDIPNIGSGNELFGPVDGIGTAMAVDPSDSTGNTVYLGTIGGLYKTTDGGRTIHNLGGGQLARESIGAIGIDPKNRKLIVAGTGVSIFTLSDDAAGAGVYISHDGGTTWSRPSANIHGYGVNAVAFPGDGSILVGTTYGLWRSTDHGAAFSQVKLPTGATHPLGNWVTSIVVNPAKRDEVTVAVGYAFGKLKYAEGVIAPGNGLYRSTNNGASFTHLNSDSQLTQPLASSDPLGRTSLSYSTAPGTGGKILWALVADAGRTAGDHIAVDTPALPLSVDGNTELNGLYRSADDGATWTLQGNAQTLAAALGGTTSAAGYPLSYAAGVQADYNNWVLADPVDPNRVYLGLEEAFTGEYHDPTGALPVPSTTFTAVEKYANLCGFLTYPNTPPNTNGVACPQQIPEYGSGTTHPDQHSAAFAKTAKGFRLYSGNDGGWWSQDAHSVTDTTAAGYQGFDNGSWTSLGKPPTVLPWDVTMLQDHSILVALQDNGVGHIRTSGSAYQVCGGDGVYVFPGANAHSYYCGIDGQQILGTTDDFAHTINVTPGITGATFLSPWYVDPSDPNHLIAAAGDVEETTAGLNSNTYDPTQTLQINTTWTTVFTPPTPPHSKHWDASAVTTRGAVGYAALCSVCRPSLATGTVSDPRVVTPKVATNVKSGCKPAKASTACWHLARSSGLPHEQISDFAVDPKNPHTVYVSLRQMIVMGADPAVTGAQKVMVSHDGGDTFSDLTGNLPVADAHRIALRNGQLYVATDVGVFTAKAGSKTWHVLGTGLPQVAYRSMRLSLDGRYLVAGAYGRGAWVYDFGATANSTSSGGRTSGSPSSGGSGSLPRTGLSPLLPVIGLGLLAAAGPMAARRRRRSGQSTT